MSDVVLVHGTTQNATGFWRLTQALTRRGHRALSVDVPSSLPTSAAYTDVLADQLPADLHAPVVVAHSASGLVLPALAARLGAAHQVWIAAFVPDHHGARSLLDEVRADPGALFHPEWIGVDPATDPALAVRFLFHDVTEPATMKAALATVATTDLSALYAEAPQRDPSAVASTYLQPTGDRALTQAAMTAMAHDHLGVDPVLVPGGHNAYVAHPEPIAEAIDAATRG